MSVLSNETAAVLDDLRKTIAKYETRLAKGRRKSRKSDADAMQAQAFLEITLNSLKHTLQQIEKSHEVVATSHALLEEMEQIERRRADQAGHRTATSLLPGQANPSPPITLPSPTNLPERLCTYPDTADLPTPPSI